MSPTCCCRARQCGASTRTRPFSALQPGEASFHHGWTLHASMPNRSNDAASGCVQYIASHVKQTKHDRDTVMLVRGEDRLVTTAMTVRPKPTSNLRRWASALC